MSHGRYANRALLAACWLFGSAWLSFAPAGAAQIGAMREMEGCAALVKAANDLGQRTLNDFRLKEKQYDVDTRHGRTQGAWIE